jgi:ketosteroid isomerase-like protein
MSAADDFQQTLQQVRAADQHFYAGDATPIKAWWSHADDVTILGGLGAYEKGWEQVSPRLDWAATHLRGGNLTIEPLAMGVSGDLAYTIDIERSQVRVAGRDELSPTALRVTYIFRREEGSWKIVHRHADAIMEKIEATELLQK